MRHEFQLVVDVDELVAQRREDDAADEGAGAVRVEHVGVFLQADAQRLRHGGHGEEAGGEGGQSEQSSHGTSLL